MRSELVSIIVPVYNCEKYLSRCIESLLVQTYTNLEIILIDDGSTDGSGIICDAFAEADQRISVLHQANSGVSCARNSGLEIMQGDYCTFVDADDYVSPVMIEILVNACRENKVQLAVCGHFDCDPETSVAASNTRSKVELLDTTEKFRFTREYAYPSVWGKLFSRCLVADIRFDGDLYIGEDALFFARALKKAEKIAFVHDKLYCYVLYHNSANHGRFTNKRKTEVVAWNRIIAQFRNYPDPFLVECKAKLAFAYYAGARAMMINGNESDADPWEYLACAKRLVGVVMRSGYDLVHKLGFIFFCIATRAYVLCYRAVRKGRT